MVTQSTLRVINWNVEWKKITSDKGKVIKQLIDELRPHVVCLTEAHTDFFTDGHVVYSDADFGFVHNQPTRRKVVLWSASPWTDIDYGVAGLPPGRFVGATTSTPLGEIRFLGVCIPWKDAHVRGGKRKQWEDHRRYLDELPKVRGFGNQQRLILLGDFNQRIPRTRAPESVYEQLRTVISPFQIATEGEIEHAPSQAIDHVCHTSDLRATSISILSNDDPQLGKLADHFGFCIDFDCD